MIKNLFSRKNATIKAPTLEEFIDRGFSPKNGKIDVLFIYPPSTVATRLGTEDIGDVGGENYSTWYC